MVLNPGPLCSIMVFCNAGKIVEGLLKFLKICYKGLLHCLKDCYDSLLQYLGICYKGLLHCHKNCYDFLLQCLGICYKGLLHCHKNCYDSLLQCLEICSDDLFIASKTVMTASFNVLKNLMTGPPAMSQTISLKDLTNISEAFNKHFYKNFLI